MSSGEDVLPFQDGMTAISQFLKVVLPAVPYELIAQPQEALMAMRPEEIVVPLLSSVLAVSVPVGAKCFFPHGVVVPAPGIPPDGRDLRGLAVLGDEGATAEARGHAAAVRPLEVHPVIG